MSKDRSYEPMIREGGADTETQERLGSKQDPFPYVKKGDKRIYDYSDEVICTEMLELDKQLTDTIFESVNYFQRIYNYRILKQCLHTVGLTSSVSKFANTILDKHLRSATEAENEATAAIRSIFNKLVEYIRKVSAALSEWIKSVSDIQARSISTMADLNNEYVRIYRTKKQNLNNLTIDIQDGGCPTAKALLTIVVRAKALIDILQKENNATNIVLVKLINKTKKLYTTGDTKELDEFLEKNKDDTVDRDILDEFMKLQDKFTGIGVTFSEDMVAAFEDVLEYRNDSVIKLGYEEDTFKKIIANLPNQKDILQLKYLCNILNRLSTYFSSINVDTQEDVNAEDSKYDTYINTIPKILTIVISAYRTTTIAIREYTTTALSIEKTIIEQLR